MVVLLSNHAVTFSPRNLPPCRVHCFMDLFFCFHFKSFPIPLPLSAWRSRICDMLPFLMAYSITTSRGRIPPERLVAWEQSPNLGLSEWPAQADCFPWPDSRLTVLPVQTDSKMESILSRVSSAASQRSSASGSDRFRTWGLLSLLMEVFGLGFYLGENFLGLEPYIAVCYVGPLACLVVLQRLLYGWLG